MRLKRECPEHREKSRPAARIGRQSCSNMGKGGGQGWMTGRGKKNSHMIYPKSRDPEVIFRFKLILWQMGNQRTFTRFRMEAETQRTVHQRTPSLTSRPALALAVEIVLFFTLPVGAFLGIPYWCLFHPLSLNHLLPPILTWLDSPNYRFKEYFMVTAKGPTYIGPEHKATR